MLRNFNPGADDETYIDGYQEGVTDAARHLRKKALQTRTDFVKNLFLALALDVEEQLVSDLEIQERARSRRERAAIGEQLAYEEEQDRAHAAKVVRLRMQIEETESRGLDTSKLKELLKTVLTTQQLLLWGRELIERGRQRRNRELAAEASQLQQCQERRKCA
jgi:hypothetical protein